MSRVELFEKIRRDREFAGLSMHALAREYGVHRRTVRQALESPLPPERKRPEGRPAPALGPYREWIDQILIADQTAPRKQRHTAKRIADRLAEEHGVVVAGSTMRDHVRKRRRELGLAAEAFCPQVHDPGVTAEVDWGEATVSLAGVLDGARPVSDALVLLGGVFRDGVRDAVPAGVLRGARARAELVLGRIHDDPLRQPGERGEEDAEGPQPGRERAVHRRCARTTSTNRGSRWWGSKGPMRRAAWKTRSGDSGETTWCRCRRSPTWRSSTSLLLACCIRDLDRMITGQSETVGARLSQEIDVLRPLPGSPFPTWEQSTHRVNQKSMIVVRRNHYSVPVRLVGSKVAARVGAREIDVIADGRLVATHPRLRGSQLRSARLDHYLELLARKPGALEHSLALRQEREQGRWPECFDELWQQLRERVGASEAARQIVDVLLLCRDHDPKIVELAVRGALTAGAVDGRAVALLCDRKTRPPADAIELPDRLAQHDRPTPGLGEYDQLLGREAVEQ